MRKPIYRVKFLIILGVIFPEEKCYLKVLKIYIDSNMKTH